MAPRFDCDLRAVPEGRAAALLIRTCSAGEKRFFRCQIHDANYWVNSSTGNECYRIDDHCSILKMRLDPE